MYRLHLTETYQHELRAIDGGSGRAAQLLERGVYEVLRRQPQAGIQGQTPGIWIVFADLIVDVLRILIAYRIDEQSGTVTLLSIRSTDVHPSEEDGSS